MLDHGAMFAFALVLCVLCEECAYPEPCRRDRVEPFRCLFVSFHEFWTKRAGKTGDGIGLKQRIAVFTLDPEFKFVALLEDSDENGCTEAEGFLLEDIGQGWRQSNNDSRERSLCGVTGCS